MYLNEKIQYEQEGHCGKKRGRSEGNGEQNAQGFEHLFQEVQQVHRHFVIDHIDILGKSIYDSSNRGGIEKRHRASEDALQEPVVEAARGVNLSMDSNDESHVDENTYNKFIRYC